MEVVRSAAAEASSTVSIQRTATPRWFRLRQAALRLVIQVSGCLSDRRCAMHSNALLDISRVVTLFLFFVASATGEEPRAEFECRFTNAEFNIDGRADERAWQTADVIDHFYLPWLQDKARPAAAETEARLLWSRKYLYFFARMQDDDLYADITEHDGKTWNNDVFELFFKPARRKPGYFEFHVSAAGTVMDVFLPRRGDGRFEEHLTEREFHIDQEVVLNGTLNARMDKDAGWSVEGRIPWYDFIQAGGRPQIDEEWTFALCRYDYSARRDEPELSTCAPLTSKDHADFHLHEDYAALRFTVDRNDVLLLSEADRLTELKANWRQVPSRIAGSPDPPLPFVAKRVLPKLKLASPIFVVREPLSRRLLFIDQDKAHGPTRIAITTDDPADGEFSTVYDFPEGAVAYSIAFHPHYSQNGFLYVGWNGTLGDEEEKHSRVTRLTVNLDDKTIDPASAKEILAWPSNGHNGAAVTFGLDGMLYITSGDGTSDSDTNLTGQGTDHLLAKVLRIDVDHPDNDKPYRVPSDNPFAGRDGIRPETYALGLRNPWRMTTDRETGHIWVGNNGQDLWEQAYLVRPGDNYGWSVYEGSHIFYANREMAPVPHVKPTLEHPHSEARSLTGGIVYYGSKHPTLRGAYIYGDYSTGKIWGARVQGDDVVWHQELADTTLAIAAFAEDADGELLIVDHQSKDGGLYTLEPNPTSEPDRSFPRKLSETGLFDSVPEHRVHPGLIPYSVNSPLWSDGTFKQRFVCLPAEVTGNDKTTPTRINLQAKGSWDLPDGTVTVKSFGLEQVVGDPASRRWIETRIMTRQQGEWVGYSYAWNDEQTEAVLVGRDGLDAEFEILAADAQQHVQKWRYPSRSECMVCHSRAAKFVLGLSTVQWNCTHDYSGAEANQLEVLEWLGLLKLNWKSEALTVLKKDLADAGRSDEDIAAFVGKWKVASGQRSVPVTTLLADRGRHMDRLSDPYDTSESLTARVRSYLHSNCAQCHVNAGGGNAQMQLTYSASLKDAKIVDVEPLHDRFGIENARLIAPGSPERSVLLHRLKIRGRGQMPQLATDRVDEQIVALFTDWIAQLPQEPVSDGDDVP